jgi:steroid 5-alpha reductase family enzyme
VDGGLLLVWIGLFIYIFPTLSDYGWLTIIGPIWIMILLVFISGIPLLEKTQKEKYGSLPSFLEYVQKTKKLIPGIY